jgi:molecular chaperone DnaK
MQKDPTYQRVLRIAAFYAEKAKIELSAQPTTRISAGKSQLASRDQAGKEIYLDIPFDRPQLENLVFD